MARPVLMDVSQRCYLEALAGGGRYTAGLVMGQAVAAGGAMAVVHLARTPPPAGKDLVPPGEDCCCEAVGATYYDAVEEIPLRGLCEHARLVTRMLPGGMWVLGLFVVGPGDVLSDGAATRHLHAAHRQLRAELSRDPHLRGACPEPTTLVAHLSEDPGDLRLARFSSDSRSLLTDLRLETLPRPLDWHAFSFTYDLDRAFALRDLGVSASGHVGRMRDFLDDFAEDLAGSACLVNDLPWRALSERYGSLKEFVAAAGGRGRASVNLVLPRGCQLPEHQDMVIGRRAGYSHVRGSIMSVVYMHDDSTLREFARAVKDDVLRSLASRLEVYWSLFEERAAEEEVRYVHELPKRVFVPLPLCEIEFSDYLTLGIKISDSLGSIHRNLDVDVNIDSIKKSECDIVKISLGEKRDGHAQSVATFNQMTTADMKVVIYTFILICLAIPALVVHLR
ncbi:protein odr-4 homolog [Bacillus rossius redtenbacheri]|uniref:protein odr-4 homolog n=1 Tax=Bacillus rossius redtenbacheri TaxID=93214 RepID=UPI002FDE8354